MKTRNKIKIISACILGIILISTVIFILSYKQPEISAYSKSLEEPKRATNILQSHEIGDNCYLDGMSDGVYYCRLISNNKELLNAIVKSLQEGSTYGHSPEDYKHRKYQVLTPKQQDGNYYIRIFNLVELKSGGTWDFQGVYIDKNTIIPQLTALTSNDNNQININFSHAGITNEGAKKLKDACDKGYFSKKISYIKQIDLTGNYITENCFKGDSNYKNTKVILDNQNSSTPSQPKLSVTASCSNPNDYERQKTITATVNSDNAIKEVKIGDQVAKSVGNGKYSTSKDITKNGTYTVKVTDIKGYTAQCNVEVDKIDREKPTYTVVQKPIKDSNKKTLVVTATDNASLEYIKVGGITIYEGFLPGITSNGASRVITKTGIYKVEIGDMAGNIYSNDEYVEIDDKAPQVTNITVEKVNKDNNKGIVTAAGECRVAIDDSVIVKMTTDEEMDGQSQEVYLNGKKYEEVTNKNANKNTLSFDINFTQDIIEKYGLNEYICLEVKNLKDKYSNIGEYKNDKLIYLDKIVPTIKKVEITGGTRSKDNKVIEIYQDQEIKLVINTSEKLSNKPAIDIGGYKTEATYEKDVKIDNKTYPQYIVTVDTDELIKSFKEQGKENSYVPVKISDYKDSVENEGDIVTIDENNKSSNDVCLVYGKAITGELYFSAIGGTRDGSIGDINGDGLINNYDYLLLTRHLAEQEELTEEQQIYANADKRKGLGQEDLIALRKIIEETGKNEFCEGVSADFKIFNQDNKEIPVNNLEISILEGSNLATYSTDNGYLTITSNSSSGEILIQVVQKNENEYEQQIGKMKFILKKTPVDQGGFVVLDGFNKYKVMGDLNRDGFATGVDTKMIQIAIAQSPIDLNNEEKILANVYEDYNSDGGININIKDATAIQKIDYYNYNGMKRGDKINLKFNSSELKTFDKIENASIEWFTKTETNSVTIKPNNTDGTAEITINDNAKIGEKITVKCVVTKEEGIEDKDYEAQFNIEVVDEVKVDLSHKEVIYDFSNLPEENTILKATTNVINREIEWKVLDESIAKIEVDEFGDAEVIPLKRGKTEITATVDGVTATCTVDIIEPITGLEVDKQEVELIEGEETNIKITKTPENATEMPLVITNNANIARVSKDEETGEYKLVGVSEGSTTVTVSSPSKENISKEIQVNVKKLTEPILKTIRIEQEEEEKLYKIGEEINIKFIFTNELKGEAPNLNIRFGNYGSIEEPEFVGFEDNNTAIAYKYIVQEGDNGVLTVEDLTGGTLTDITGKLNAVLTTNNEEETDGIQKVIEAVKVDGIRPEIEIYGDIDSGNYWLTEGDIAKIKIISSEELLQAPEVIMGGQEVEVEGDGKEFTASIEITKEIEEGYLEIKVKGYQDIAGNEGEEVIATDDNIHESIMVDYTGTKISSIELVKEEGKEYKTGDKFGILVTFKDDGENRIEQIVAEEAPKLNLRFGGKEAKGNMENDYEEREYRSSILYTYTISEYDEGKVSVDSVTGRVTDRAGNETDLSKQEDLPELTDFNTKKEDKDGIKPSGKLPNAGKIAKTALITATAISIIIGVPYIVNRKKYRQV